MGISSALTGGIMQGYKFVEDIKDQRAQREQRAAIADREKVRFDNEQSDRKQAKDMETELADYTKQFFAPAPNYGSSPDDPAMNGDMANAGAQSGVNPFAPGNELKLAQYHAGMYGIQAKHGKMDPAKLKEVLAFRETMDKQGMTKAFQQAYMTGDPAALAPIAQQYGVDEGTMKIVNVKNQTGSPVPHLVGTIKGQPFQRDLGIVSAALGLDGLNKAIDADRDNARQEFDSVSQDNYRRGMVGAAQTRAEKAGSGSSAEGYDLNTIRNLVNDHDVYYSPQSGKIGPDGKAPRDAWASNKIRDLAIEIVRDGGGKYDEVTAVKIAKAAIEKVTQVANRQDDWSKGGFTQTDGGYDGFREMALRAMIEKGRGGGAQPAQATADQTAAAPGAAPAAALPRKKNPMELHAERGRKWAEEDKKKTMQKARESALPAFQYKD